MLEYVSAICTVIVSLQVLKVVCGFVYSQFIAPAMNAGTDLKKMGKWAGKNKICTYYLFSSFYYNYLSFEISFKFLIIASSI